MHRARYCYFELLWLRPPAINQFELVDEFCGIHYGTLIMPEVQSSFLESGNRMMMQNRNKKLNSFSLELIELLRLALAQSILVSLFMTREIKNYVTWSTVNTIRLLQDGKIRASVYISLLTTPTAYVLCICIERKTSRSSTLFQNLLCWMTI
jgi:hypothetical protein